MVRQWKTIRVFISSTFRDTHFERDALTRLVFPELRQWCEDRYLHITEVDLRWGVTQEESAAGKAIEICLDEIDRSDFFLCIVGSRYGWVPDEYEVGNEPRFDWVRKQNGLSITELEIMRGGLNADDECAEKVSHAMFYFRDERFLDNIESPKKLCEFTDGSTKYVAGNLTYVGDPDKQRKLKVLKDRIRSAKEQGSGRIKLTLHEDYESLYNVDDRLSEMDETILHSFCSMVLKDLKDAINEQYPLVEMESYADVDEVVLENSFHQAYMDYRLSTFEERDDVVAKILAFAQAETLSEKGPFIVSGDSGIGKSSVLSRACAKLQADSQKQEEKALLAKLRPSDTATSLAKVKVSAKPKPKPRVLLRYFAGASPGSLQIQNLLRVLVAELRKCIKKYRPKKRADQLWGMLRTYMAVGQSVNLAGKLRENKKAKVVKQKAKRSHHHHHRVASSVPSNFQDLVEEFKRTLTEACEHICVVLVIDNLDHVVRDKNNAVMLNWLPMELPKNLRLIVGVEKDPSRGAAAPLVIPPRGRPSSPSPATRRNKRPSSPTSPMSDSGVDYRRHETLNEAKSNLKHQACSFPNVHQMERYERRSFLESFEMQYRHHQSLEVPPLSPDMSRKLISARLGLYGKKLDPKQMQTMLNKTRSGNPTWVVIACEELRVFPYFDQVTKRILELADDLPHLLEQMIRRLEQDHGPRFVRDALSILVCSRDGLYEHEIVGILGVPLSSWSQLFYSIKPLLSTRSGGSDLISFSHRNFSLAVLKRYFSGPKEGSEDFGVHAAPIHARLALYFKSVAYNANTDQWNADNGRALSCLPYHLLHGKMLRTLEATLTDLQFVEALLTAGAGFTWVDDLTSALSAFERSFALHKHQVNAQNPGLGLDLSLLQTGDSRELSQQHETKVTSDMIRRIRDYHSFAQVYTPELVASPYLVFQYAANLPDTNAAAKSAIKLWENSMSVENNKRRTWLRWVNKVQEAGPCLMTLSGHTGAVLYCDVSRDEKRVVSASADKTLRVWYAQTGESDFVLDEHKDAVTCACFSPTNSQVIVSTSRDGTAKVWVKGWCARTFTRHQHVPILCCAISECGQWVATGDQSGRLLIWDIFSEEDCIHDFSNFHDGVIMCRFSGNNEYIFAAGKDKTIRGWSLLDGSQYMCKSGDAMAFSAHFADQREKLWYCLRTSAMRLKVFDAKYVNRSIARPSEIDVSPSGTIFQSSTILSAGGEDAGDGDDDFDDDDNEGLKVDPSLDESESLTLRQHVQQQPVVGRTRRLSRSTIYTQASTLDLHAAVKSKKDIPRVTLKDEDTHLASTCALSPANRIATGRLDGNIAVFDGDTGKKICMLHGHIGTINHVAYSASGRRLVSSSQDTTVKIWNPKRARLVGITPHKTKVLQCTFSQTSKGLSVLSISQEGQLTMWNAATGYCTSLQRSSKSPQEILRDAQFTAAGDHYVTVNNVVRIYSCGRRKPGQEGRVWVLEQPNVGLWDMTPCGKVFACVETGSTDVHLWALYSNPVKRIRTLIDAHEKRITSCRFSLDGAMLYTAGNDGCIKVWDSLEISSEKYSTAVLETSSQSRHLRRSSTSHDDLPIPPVLALADAKDMGLASLIQQVLESPDGSKLLVLSDSPDMKLWDVDGALELCPNLTAHSVGGLVTSLHGHTNRVTCADWAGHGYSFASGSNNGTIRLWDTATLQCTTIISGHTSSVVKLAYLPDARRLASISSDKTLSIWSAGTGEQLNSMVLGAPLSTMAISPSGHYIAIGDVKGDLRILELMNPFAGADSEVAARIAESANETAQFVENEEFPFAAPTKILHVSVKGNKKWEARCQIFCPHCCQGFSINGNSEALISKHEYEVETQGVNHEVLRDMRFLNRCVHCRNVVRLTPFCLDRSAALTKLRLRARASRKKLVPHITSHNLHLLADRHETSKMVLGFYESDANAKMTPFHSRHAKAASAMSTSSSNKSEVSGEQNLMTRHLHTLSLKSKDKKLYTTFKSRVRPRTEQVVEQEKTSFVKSFRKKQHRKQPLAMGLSSEVAGSPNWVSVFSAIDEFEKHTSLAVEATAAAEAAEQAAKAAAACEQHPEDHHQVTFEEEAASTLNFTKSVDTLVACDNQFLELEGPLIRRCKTASQGVRRKKVLESTTDLRHPENLFSIAHGEGVKRSQLDAIRDATPIDLDVSPNCVDFGTLCEDSVYRFPVKLLNKGPSLMRIRLTVTTTVNRLKPTDDGSKKKKQLQNAMTAVMAPDTNPLIQGLSATVYVEVSTRGGPGQIYGLLRIATNSGYLFSTPIYAAVISQADYAASVRALKQVTHDSVIQTQNPM